MPFIGPAWAAVSRFDALLGAVPNPDLLVGLLIIREAVLSSRIEGTQATMDEVLQFEAGHEPESPAPREDIREVLNYRQAVRHAEARLKELPLSLRVIRETHWALLQGVRGEKMAPGDFRRVQNWIGPRGCSIENAKFVPIGVQDLPEAMSAWERYIHRSGMDQLVRLAVLHAEFEALHPFLDGNGRLGLMLVPLYMWQHEIIRAPQFYISAYFEAHRDTYYESLLSVSRDDDWTGWCRFFLEAVQMQAKDNLARVQGMVSLYDDMKRRMPDLTRSHYAIRALDWIFANPIFSSTAFVANAGISAPTARRFLHVMVSEGLLRVVRRGRGRRPGIYAF